MKKYKDKTAGAVKVGQFPLSEKKSSKMYSILEYNFMVDCILV
jgi:hypothetical protein